VIRGVTGFGILSKEGMESSEPLVRARYLRDWLARIDHEEDPWRARFFETLPQATRDAVDAAPRSGWLPMRLHVQVADLMQHAYGPARAHDHYRRSFASALRGGIFGPLLRTGTRLFGATPATFLRWAHLGWDASFRNAGKLTGQIVSPNAGKLVYSGLPPICTASDAWLDSAQGSGYGSLDALELDGVVRLDKSRRDEGRLELAIEWSVERL
jgi:hypothetical protein